MEGKGRLFGWFLARFGNAVEAGRRVRLESEEDMLRLLEDKGVCRAAGRYRAAAVKESRSAALLALARLANYSGQDAVKLLCRWGEVSGREIEQMDLFGVSAIKVGSGGAVEVKFFDRAEAARLLLGESESSGKVGGLYRALQKSAAAITFEDEPDPGVQEVGEVG